MWRVANKNIWEFTDYSLLAISLWLLLSIGLAVISRHYLQEINTFLDSLFNLTKHSGWIKEHMLYVLTALGGYVLFLGHLKHKKWLVFSEDAKWSYATAWLLIFSAFNTFVFPLYLWYLSDRYFVYNYFGIQTTLFLLLFILINAALLNRFQQKMYKGKWFLWFVFLGITSLIAASFFYTGYFEIFALFLIGWVLNYVTNALLLSYTRIVNNYDALTAVHDAELDLRRILKNDRIVAEFQDWLSNWNEGKKDALLLWLFNNLNQFLILISFVFSFAFILVGLKENFNLFSIVYIHFSFILFYFRFTLLTNKFPWLVNVKLNGKLIKNVFLLENNKEKIVFINKERSVIATPNCVSFIEVKNPT